MHVPHISTNRPEAVECFLKAMAALQEPTLQACGITRLTRVISSGCATQPFLPCVPAVVHAMEKFGSDEEVAGPALECLAFLAGATTHALEPQ